MVENISPVFDVSWAPSAALMHPVKGRTEMKLTCPFAFVLFTGNTSESCIIGRQIGHSVTYVIAD